MKRGKGEKRFGIFLTGKGLRKINSEMEMNVMELLAERDLTLASISRSLNAPASTVLANIEKLVENNMVTSYPDEVDRRQIYYANVSIMIMSSVESKSDDTSVFECDAVKYNAVSTRTFADMTKIAFAVMMKYGINAGYVADLFGNYLVDAMKERFANLGVKDAFNQMTSYLKECGIESISVSSYDPIVLRIKTCISMPLEAADSLGCFTTMYCHVATYCTGIDHSVTEVSADGGALLFKISPIALRRPLDLDAWRRQAPEDDGKCPEFCLVLDEFNTVRMIDAPVQMAIIRFLDRIPCTAKAVAKGLGISDATASSNLTRLEWAKLVQKGLTNTGAEIYKPRCSIIMAKCKNKAYDIDVMRDLFVSAIDNPRRFFESLYRYSISAFNSIGIDPAPFQRHLGMIVVREDAEKFVNLGFEESIYVLSGRDSGHAPWLNIESFTPLTISSVETYMSRVGGLAVIQYYIGGIVEAIRVTTGERYCATFIEEKVKDGNPSFRFTLEPENHIFK